MSKEQFEDWIFEKCKTEMIRLEEAKRPRICLFSNKPIEKGETCVRIAYHSRTVKYEVIVAEVLQMLN